MSLISARKRSAPIDGGELGPEHLEGDAAVVADVLGEVDGRHAGRADLAVEAVAVREGGLETAEELGMGEFSAGGAMKMLGVGVLG